MLNFTVHIPTRIHFGKGQVKQLKEELKPYGKILLAYGGGSVKKIGLYQRVIDLLKEIDVDYVELPGIQSNPRLSSVYHGIELCKTNDVQFILGVGGGSVIDCVKAIAAGAKYDGDIWDVYQRKGSVTKALPLGSVLTLSATGSEMNGGSVISREASEEKLSMISNHCKPVFSILDPEYTFSVSPYQTAAGTVDMISHLLEQYFTPVQEGFLIDRVIEGLIKTAIEFGPKAIENPQNYDARGQLMWCSSLALNGLPSCGRYGDWATHLIEHEVSAIYDLTHGVGLSIITPAWMRHVLDDQGIEKFIAFAENIFGITDDDPYVAANKGIDALEHFFKSLNMPVRFSEVDIRSDRFEEMAEKSVRFGDLGHFKKLNKESVLEILKNAQ